MTDDMIDISALEFDSDMGGGRSSNYGGGMELLMNTNVGGGGGGKGDLELDEDLSRLENELNGLVEELPSGGGSSSSNSSSSSNNTSNNSRVFSSDRRPTSMFEVRRAPSPPSGSGPSVSFDFDAIHAASVGKSEGGDSGLKSWDGYDKVDSLPVNPPAPATPVRTKEELLRDKLRYLRKLEQLEKKGVELTKKYSMESSLDEMMGEYETIMDDKAKLNAVKFQGNTLMAIINGIEYLNGKFDPFDLKLDGWSDQFQENITDYDDIFGELYEKYKNKAGVSPELKLLFQLGGGAIMVHMTNSMFKTAMPGMDDILRQNPDLMRNFQAAAVNSMAQTHPGLSGFMNNVAGSDMRSSAAATPNYHAAPMSGSGAMGMGMGMGGGPPPPIATQGPHAAPPPAHRPGNNAFSRPDLNYGGGYTPSVSSAPSSSFAAATSAPRSAAKRPEMKGPSDISDLLSGIKTKTINIQQPQQQSQRSASHLQQQQQTTTAAAAATPLSADTSSAGFVNDSSTISISDLKDMQSGGSNRLPAKSGRRKKSASANTISLDF